MALLLTPHISYFDKSFKESNTRDYTLSIQLSINRLAFTVYNPSKNKFIGIEQYIFDDVKNIEQLPSFLGKVLNNLPSFGYPFKKVYFMYQNKFSTLIPEALFVEAKKNTVLGFNQPFQENSRIISDKLTNNQAVNVYYLSTPIIEKVKDFWPNVKILHFSTALIESLSVNFKNKTDAKTIFVNVRDNCFDLVYFKENKLHFHNSFEFKTKEDFIYFLLISIDQLMLNPEDVNLLLLGNINVTDDIYNMIHQYIKNYKFISKNDNFGYSYILDEIKFYKYYTLFNVLQCE